MKSSGGAGAKSPNQRRLNLDVAQLKIEEYHVLAAKKRPEGEDTVTDTAGSTQKTASQPRSSRTTIFIYDLVVVGALLVIAILYFKNSGWFDFGGPDHPNVNLSIHCMWFGALGGIIISLKGVYDHAVAGDPWKDSFDLWHIGRPVSGGIAGLMTFLLLSLVNPSVTPTEQIVYAAAFILGTQERRFFDLLSEIARLIVQVPSDKAAPASVTVASITPSQGVGGTTQVTIAGAGFDPKATASLGGAALANVVVKDGTSITGVAPARPAGAAAVDLVVTNPDGTSFTLPKGFTFTG
jgi:hypothetical protein